MPHEQAKPSPQPVSGRPRQVSPSPLPSLAECLEAKAAGDRMYFGFYAGAGALHRALLRCFPDTLKDTEPYNMSILWPALLYIRGTAGRDDLTLNMGIVSQRVKDQIPSIEEDVGEHALVIGLFPMEADAFEDRITQEGASKISKLFGTPPTWWRVSQTLM